MPAPPLTHHEILGLVAPFTRRGRHVDLAASQRQERRLVFKPPVAAGDTPLAGALHETLQLDCLRDGMHRLTRSLRRPDGVQASVHAEGADVAALLAQVEAVPAERHFVTGPDFVIARHYTLNGARGEPAMSPILTHGRVHVEGLVFTLTVPSARSAPGDIMLEPTASDGLTLPEDLLAVLGWNWTRLIARGQGWSSKLRMGFGVAQRTHRGEAALELCAAHLARTLAEPPARFHERLLAARWGVFFRRGLPALTALSLLILLVTLVSVQFDPPGGPWLALYHVPTLLFALSFCLQEYPRLEIPPRPRRLQAPGWYRASGPRPQPGPSAVGTET